MNKLACASILLSLLCSLVFATSPVQYPVDQVFGHEQRMPEENASLEIGSPLVGLEFHHNRPVPSRISFYYPVANSIDISHDYWTRDTTRVMHFILHHDGRADTLDTLPFECYTTPYSARFVHNSDNLNIQITYNFPSNSPFFRISFRFPGFPEQEGPVLLECWLAKSLRTSHSYNWSYPDTMFVEQNSLTLTYPFVNTDCSNVVLNAIHPHRTYSMELLENAASGQVDPWVRVQIPIVSFDTYQPSLELDIGSHEYVPFDPQFHAYNWIFDQNVYQAGDFDGTQFRLPDTSLISTADWARAVLDGNRHWINHHYVLMPCPAQYNFFFTHDMLVCDLASVLYDPSSVRNDLEFLNTLTREDSTLAHAYYWRDSTYITEYCSPDSWNYYWFIRLLASYLTCTGDDSLAGEMFPVAVKSMETILSQVDEDGLVHGKGPDWWDAGNVPGARAYHTSLAWRAIDDFLSLAIRLDEEVNDLGNLLTIKQRFRSALLDVLWDEENGFLMNTIEDTIDPHFYAGSLVAPWTGILEEPYSSRLVETAEEELLAQGIGIRNAMPADFLELEEAYRFHGPEMGGLYLYFNGGSWCQNTAWYVLAQQYSGHPDEALESLRNYLTIDGIAASPNGQPSFFEYRNTNPDSSDYGKIDKPTFSWAAGWYLYCLYSLCGIDCTPYSIALSPQIPEYSETISSRFTLFGNPVDVSITGNGDTFSEIRWDNNNAYSAILCKHVRTVELECGNPLYPYVESIDAIIGEVVFLPEERTLEVQFQALPGKETELVIVSPGIPTRIQGNATELSWESVEIQSGNGWRNIITVFSEIRDNWIVVHFGD